MAVLRSALDEGGLAAAEIKRFGSDREFVVRARLDEQEVDGDGMEATADAVRAALDAGLGADGYELIRTESVGPKVGGELQRKAGIAVLVSFATTLVYLATRFEWRFGLAAVLAAGHEWYDPGRGSRAHVFRG